MGKLCSKNVVGILIGKIVASGHPICIRLYNDGLGIYQTRQFELLQFNTSQYAAKTFLRVLDDEVLAIYESAERPRWYFLQLDAYYCPHKMQYWALPYTAHCRRWARLVRE